MGPPDPTSPFLLGGRDRVARLGFGAAFRPVDFGSPWGTPADADGVRDLLRHAVDLGVNLIDTADSYGPETSEQLIAASLFPYDAALCIATKGGVIRTGARETRVCGRPDYIRQACDASLRRLRTDCIGLYQLHWPDKSVPWADQVGVLADLTRAGKIRHIGLSNVSAAQVREAAAIAPIAAVQARLGPGDPDATDVLLACETLGAALIAYSPLAAARARAPWLLAAAARRGVSAAQVALSWLLHRSPNVIVIPGTVSRAHLIENMAAAAIRLSPQELAEAA